MATETKQQLQFFSPKQAAEFLNISLQTMYKFNHAKVIRYYKRGKHVYYRREDLENYILEGEVLSHSQIEAEAKKH